MEHVPTLCAVGTVGIAATGFALGRLEQGPISTFKEKKTTAWYNRSSIGAAPTGMASLIRGHGSVPSSPSYSGQPRVEVPFNLTSFDYNRNRADDGHHAVSLSSPKEPVPGSVRLRRRRQTYTSPPVRTHEDQSAVPSTRRPSSSWLRRLSVISTKTESPLSSPSPVSPSINGSTTPILPWSSNQRREPNKLVKRSTSQHSVSAPLCVRSSRSMSGTSALRRPATSYQRSAHRQYQAVAGVELEPTITCDHRQIHLQPDLIEEHPEVAWRPYFEPFPAATEKFSRRSSTPARHKDQAVRRIVAESSAPPTLLLASSVTRANYEVGPDDERCNSASLPPQFSNPFQSSDRPPKQATPPFRSEKRKSRQSFSFSDIIGGGYSTPRTTSRRDSLRRIRDGSLSQGEVRNYSTPLPELSETARSDRSIPGLPLLRRRSITYPTLFRRPQTASQVESAFFHISEFADPPGSSKSRVPPYGLSGSDVDASVELPAGLPISHAETESSLPNPERRSGLGSSSSIVQQSRAKRLSVAASEPPSTVVGSDDTRVFTSGEEDETDFQSDTAFDSFRTHDTTSSSSGARGPRIETIFDESSPPDPTKERLAKLADLIPGGSFPAALSDQSSRISERNTPSISIAVPCLSKADKNAIPVASAKRISGDSTKSSSSYSLQHRHSLSSRSMTDGEARRQALERSASVPAPFNAEDRGEFHASSAKETSAASIMPSTRAVKSDCRDPARNKSDLGTRVNLFDWSEQPRSDREHQGSNPRPRTVHGKQGGDTRGSRPAGRKGPNALHLRSQSVPVSRELALSNDTRQSSAKFGTWGLGSKGVSEDWDGDFEFDDSDGQSIGDDSKASVRTNRHAMKVPKAIMERQASVHGQFGQVQELTLLVQELKRLRLQANLLHIVQGQSNELWKEAEGIVNLATLDDEESGFSAPRSPSSTTFSFDDPDDESPHGNKVRKHNNTEVRRSPLSVRMNSSQSITPPRRPAKDSSSKAKSVLETIYQQRGSPDPFDSNGQPPQKLPFDTQSLRDLVVRAGVVTRALKDIIRRAEGVTTALENGLPPNPPFSRIFDQPSHDFSYVHMMDLVENT